MSKPIELQPEAADQPLTLFDANGFLLEPSIWTDALAGQIAQTLGMQKLTDAHWAALYFLRDYYSRMGVMTSPRNVFRQLGCSDTASIHCSAAVCSCGASRVCPAPMTRPGRT